MSSGGWEVVGKNKKDRSNGKATKLTKAEKKKFIENAPKVEDFLPLNQVKTLYDNLESNKENKKLVKEKDNKTKENEERRRQQKQQQQQTEKKKQEPKEKPPKTIKDALNAINPDDFSDILTTGKLQYPEAPLIWLKNLVAYLNVKIPIEKEDAVFSGKPKDYPLSIVPKSISSTMERAVTMAGQQTAQLFYEITLTAMATDMAKGTPVVGHKIFLQLLARLNPKMTIANIPKLISVRNSYQNRKAIGLSLLWALSQAGEKDLVVGLKVWHEVMSPLLITKSYANYVVQLLNDLVFGHENVQDLTPELYLNIIEDTYSGKYNIPLTVGKDIDISIEKLRLILFKNKTKINDSKFFETLIGKINQKINQNYRDELVKALAACIITDVRCLYTWKSIYLKNLYQSNLLLTYIENNWDSLKSNLNTESFKETLLFFQNSNEKWKKGKEESLANSCIKIRDAILKKMTASNDKKFPWKRGSLFLLILIGAILTYDCQKHGSFEASDTGKLLRSSGITAQTSKLWSTTKVYTNKIGETIKNSSPEYYKIVADFCTPYIKLGFDLYLITRNLSMRLYNNVALCIEKNIPVVHETIEHYFPGIIEETKKQSIRGLQLVKTYSIIAGEKLIEHFHFASHWLQTNVFVGKLSPENLQNYANHAIDVTQTYASQTYDWVYEKVQSFSKVS
ncbi:PREDICTED: transmembrane protein 214-A [Polistes dominula]|uniref:Transmembrane protein 214-A n=1 Tax=Polistes dominula TaxID=743375 RepID=A0ABM1JED4_POLDO|nr:PREDICTED: transmembrane protein 214-A [Polistes dominula]